VVATQKENYEEQERKKKHAPGTKEQQDAVSKGFRDALGFKKMAEGGVAAPGTKEKQDAISAGFKNALGWKKMKDGGMVGIHGEESFPNIPLAPADRAAVLMDRGLIPQGSPSDVGLAMANDPVAGQQMLASAPAPAAPTMPENFMLPEVPNAQGLAPAPAPAATVKEEPGVVQTAMGQYQRGLNQEAKAAEAQAQDQSTLLQDQQKQLQQHAEALDSNMQEARKSYDEFRNYLSNPENAVNPSRFMENRSTWGRIVTAIGLGMGGAPAREFLQKQIDEDIKAQIANVNNQKTLYAENLKMLGDEQAALSRTQVMMSQIVENQIKVAALKQAGPTAQANALKLGAEFAIKSAEELAKEAQRKTARQMLAAPARPGVDQYRAQVDKMEAVDPKRAADLRSRLTPVGFADTPDDAKEVKALLADTNVARTSIQRLQQIGSTPGSSVNLSTRKEAQSLVTTLVASLNKPITGGGPMTETERALITNLATDPTRIFSLASTNKAALSTLEGFINRREAESLKARGLEVPLTSKAGPKPQGVK
jgi:hypothetical protein